MIRKMIIIIRYLGDLMRINKIFKCLLIMFFAGCGKPAIIREKLYVKKPSPPKQASQPSTPTQTSTSQEGEYITIWIHGTRLAPRMVPRRLFYSPEGLVPAASLDTQYHLRTISDTLCAADPTNYSGEYMFLFGWSGALAFEERAQAAENLYKQLKPVLKGYKERLGVRPKLRIITHSHGGNVALNLANIHDDPDFVVDELILMACPVQEATAPLIKSSLFKEVFVLYSSFDLMQIIDPQGLYAQNKYRPLLSKRRFPVQDNITQVKMKINGHTLLHSDFIRIKFVAILPQIIDKMREFHKQCSCTSCLNYEQAQQILSVYT